MSAFAVVDIGGFQEKVTKGMTLRVPCLSGQKESGEVNFDSVLLYSGDGKSVKVGSPYVDGAVVEAKVIGSGRGEKIKVFTMRKRERNRRTVGHRQGYMEIEVTGMKG